MLMELEKTMGIMPGTTICGLADGTAWATRTFINKYYDEFAARCPETPSRARQTVPLTINRGRSNVLTPMGSNTRETYAGQEQGSDGRRFSPAVTRGNQRYGRNEPSEVTRDADMHTESSEVRAPNDPLQRPVSDQARAAGPERRQPRSPVTPSRSRLRPMT